ncbi:hypothetical protein ACOMHN_010162 [Nucella lapillus]
MWCPSSDEDANCSWLDSSQQQDPNIAASSTHIWLTEDYTHVETAVLGYVTTEANQTQEANVKDDHSSRKSSDCSESSYYSGSSVSSGHEADAESEMDSEDGMSPSPTPSSDGRRLALEFHGTTYGRHGVVLDPRVLNEVPESTVEEVMANHFRGADIGDDDVFTSNDESQPPSPPHIPVWPTTDDEKKKGGSETDSRSDPNRFDSDASSSDSII